MEEFEKDQIKEKPILYTTDKIKTLINLIEDLIEDNKKLKNQVNELQNFAKKQGDALKERCDNLERKNEALHKEIDFYRRCYVDDRVGCHYF